MKPLVSIVIPTYNRAHDLERALRSVFSQTYSNWEVVVVDNNSSDNTDELLRSLNDPRIRTFKIHNNGVIAKSRNKGIREANGEYIAFLDSDDWWMPLKLQVSIRSLEQGYDVSYHDLWGVKKEAGQVFKKRMKGRQVSKPVYADLIKNGNALSTSSVVIRKDILTKIDGQSEDPQLVAAEDFECWLRIATETEKFLYMPKYLGYYWLGGGNTTNAQRYLVHLKRLQVLHIQPYTSETPIWWAYIQARSLYVIGKNGATRQLRELLKRPLPWGIRIKIWWMLLLR